MNKGKISHLLGHEIPCLFLELYRENHHSRHLDLHFRKSTHIYFWGTKITVTIVCDLCMCLTSRCLL